MVKEKKTLYKWATIITRIFDPFLVMASLVFILVFRDQPNPATAFKTSLTLFAVLILPVLVIYIIAVMTKKVSGWDMHERKGRPKILVLLLLIMTADYIFFKNLFGAGISRMMTEFLIWSLGFTAITFFYKISGHTGIAAFAVFKLIKVFGTAYWPLSSIIPLVAASRIIRRDHHWHQTFVGALYSLLIVILI